MSEENKNIIENDGETVNESADNTVNESETVYFSTSPDEASQIDNLDNREQAKEENIKPKRRVSIKTLVVSLIAVAVATLMLTYSICSSIYQSLYAKAYVDAHQNSIINGNVATAQPNELDIIGQLIKDAYYGEADSEKMMAAAIEAYVRQTGDIYAAYYTPAELEEMLREDIGKTVGVGVTIIDDTVKFKGVEIEALKIINIVKDSPAEKAGLKLGDYVYAVVIDGIPLTVSELGYDDALNKLRGEEGTTVSFILLRDNGNGLEEMNFSIVRESIVSQSVYYRIPELPSNVDKKIGVVKIANFDYTTPTQFCAAIEALKSQGCEKFVFDVRYNPGGNVSSVGAILSYFLNEGDVYIRVKDKSGNIQSDVVREVTSFEGDYAGCNVSKADIGKYKGLDVVVLCNEYTASAGELFVATFKDYGLGKIVGNTTYGKGKIQTVYYLEQYALYQYGISGVGGAIKLTTGEYYSAKSDSYDGIGIEPNEKVMLSDEAENLNIYDYQKLDPIDDQLLKAINILNG